MLSEGVTSEIATISKTVHGEIAPGASKTLSMTVHLAGIDALNQTDSQVYPASIQLVAAGITATSLVTPVIYVVREPIQPMLSNVRVPISAPIAFGADGGLVDTSFPTAIARGGAIRAPLDAVESITGGRDPGGVMDLVVDPLAITQARDVGDGYRLPDGTAVPDTDPTARQANRFVGRLAVATSHPDSVETVSLPYADPVVPAMINSGLSGALAVQRADGAAVVAGLGPATRPVGGIAEPSEGRLSDAALDWLAAGGRTNILLADAGTVDRSRWQGDLAPSPTVPFSSPSGSLTMVLPDPAIEALFQDTELLADPVRASQIVLGELALIWKQSPVPGAAGVRGVAVAPPATLPPDLWGPLLTRLNGAPFLTPVTASELVAQINPPNPNGAATLVSPDTSSFDATYIANLDRITHSVEAYGSMLPSGSVVPIELRRKLFLATAPPYLADPTAGLPWLTSVDDVTSSVFRAVLPPSDRPLTFTFTSREGTVSFAMGDPGPTPLHVIVELESNSFTFPGSGGNRQVVTLDQPGQVVSFPVVAQASGSNSIFVFVRAPNGRQIPEQPGPPAATIVVRSTALNHIALLVTIGAAFGLVLLYARRWFRRRRNPT
jgi:hypothetical protein